MIRQVGCCSGGDGRLDELVSVAFGHQWHEQTSGRDPAGILGRSVDQHVLADQFAVGRSRDL